MSIRTSIAQSVGKFTKWGLTTFTNGGSSLPGKLAQTLDPNILNHLAENYDVAVITGTNGKTLTTALTVQALAEKYPNILTNPTGSNMQQGIISAFLDAKPLKNGERGIAILEIDEGSLKHVVKALQPKVFLHTNVFRDQMDRYGEIYTIYSLMTDAAKMVPQATVIANGDSPIFNSTSLENPREFYGFDYQEDHEVQVAPNTDAILCPHCDHVLQYHSLSYANLGKYYCPNCDFKRPALTHSVNALHELTLKDSSFQIDGHDFTIPVAGLYNIYNALSAYSLASFFGLSPEQIKAGFSKAKRVFGRQEIFEIEGHQILLNLVKNPVGLNQVLDLVNLDQNPYSLVAILNNDYADGTDVSWIWDGHFEKLQDAPIQEVITSGMKAKEMTRRLEVAGLDKNGIQEVSDYQALVEQIKQSPSKNVHILATYTAILGLRKYLIDHHYLKQ
ncbi:Mur ligase family protein [Eremococcus coleocola]|uniref:Lipid II isoglutaminyl synthase (glutamine-hydrolyzing) subunit MurT n=1 Tax=Eremococcus coleocola ACS-139-V-Col8 TaxID=908337 RepID=E4KP85_9LACT|nr:Mur ligase family protein [Eremococcus coleocola]EFR31286.1 Mur ligase middle domain protein [Eremococcus coleocola ACS-139-V-Col8]